jgi:hypothetical protein
MADDNSHVRVTNMMMYQKLMDINENQITMMAELKHLSPLPDRVREVEARIDRLKWIEKVAYAGLGSGVGSIVVLIFRSVTGA